MAVGLAFDLSSVNGTGHTDPSEFYATNNFLEDKTKKRDEILKPFSAGEIIFNGTTQRFVCKGRNE